MVSEGAEWDGNVPSSDAAKGEDYDCHCQRLQRVSVRVEGMMVVPLEHVNYFITGQSKKVLDGGNCTNCTIESRYPGLVEIHKNNSKGCLPGGVVQLVQNGRFRDSLTQ